jgi:hypothetical protein
MTQNEPETLFGRATRELAAATAALVEEHDTVGTLTQILTGCARAVQADAAGLLLRNNDTANLELLASTSHRAAELELYQLHSDEGPCIDAFRTGSPVSVYGADEIAAAWPRLTKVFTKNRFTGTHATPLRWHGRSLGAVGLFFVTPPPPDQRPSMDDAAKAFTDIATLTVIHAGDISLDELVGQTRAALAERVVIEQAKGVLAFTENLDMEAAFDHLVTLAGREHQPITHIAERIVTTAAGH